MSFVTGGLFALGFVLLIFGADLLVRGASRLAVAIGISPLVVGLTVVAYGTSAPELAVSVQSSYAGVVDIAVGNVVGSNIANVLLILGLSAAVAPLVVSVQLVRLDVPLMIGLSFGLLGLGWDGQLSRLDGLMLALGGLAYTVFAIWQSRREQKALQASSNETAPSMTAAAVLGQLGLIIAGLILLVLGANWLVDGAVTLARLLSISELIIGLTIVAVGTSLPELATSVMASMRGERDIAVGNIVGSNIFNILIVLGISGATSPNGLAVSATALAFDIPVMIAVALACLPIFFTGSIIARWEGWLFLGYYVAYVVYLILSATQPAILPAYGTAMVAGVIPITILTLGLSVWYNFQRGSRQSGVEAG